MSASAYLNRREVLRTLGAGAASLALPRGGEAANATRKDPRPNIIVIMADDMGISDLGCYGSEIATPNLDRLAGGGMRFTQFYNTARCCPSRASLLTGLYAHQAGVGHMIRDMGTPAYQGYLNDRCSTIGEDMRAAGYNTLLSGKWHVGEERPHWPLDRGFMRYYGLLSGACNYWKLDEGRNFADNNTQIHDLGEGFYMTDAFTDRAVSMIDEYGPKDDPFFLYVGYTCPHWPLHAHSEDIEKYRGKYRGGWDKLRAERYVRMTEMGLINPEWRLSPRDPRGPAWEDAEHKEWQDMRMAVYAAQIERMDYGVGRIMEKVREMGQEDNTLFMFFVDNGGCHENRKENDPEIMPGPKETFQSYGYPWANASNTPFRRYKSWVHEGGTSSPLIAYWPKVIQPGETTHQVGHIIDIMPTCLDAAGASHPEGYHGNWVQPLEGKSLLPILQGKTREPHDAIFWEHVGNRAVRTGNWKLVAVNEGEWELYDLEADRSELNDLSSDKPEKVRELAALHTQWADRCGVLPRNEVVENQKKLRRKS